MKKGKITNCLTCKKEIYVAPWQLKKGFGKFCGLFCRRFTDTVKQKMSKSHKGKTAWNKGTSRWWNSPTEFKKGHSMGIRFGKDKNGSGENHWNYKGGITPINQRERSSAKYALWRTSVFQRDNYTCQICLQVGGKLQADHIKPWALFKELRFDLSNGRTLCVDCHKLFGVNPLRKIDGTNYYASVIGQNLG